MTAGKSDGTGGDFLETAAGSQIWVYTFQESYSGIENLGAKSLYLKSPVLDILLEIASTDIEPDHCVVHSLGYAYTLGEI